MPKTCWERVDAQGLYQSFTLTADGWVVSYQRLQNYTESESAGSVTFDQFLQGEYQDLAASTFGAAALAEMLAAVSYLRERT